MTTERKRGQPPTGNALSSAERQRRYRERQRGQRPDTLKAQVSELLSECARLSGLAIEREQGIKARDSQILRLSKALDAKTAEVAQLAAALADAKALRYGNPE